MFSFYVSVSLAGVSLLASVAAVLTTVGERRRRLRQFAALANEIADLRRCVTASEGIRPVTVPLPRGGVRRDRGHERAIPGPLLIAVPDLAPPTAGAAETPPELAQRYSGIWELADSGASTDAIARALDQPFGRIELIMALRRHLPDDSRD